MVDDSTGGHIGGATAAIQLLGAELKRQTKSDGNGEFRFNALPPGEYRITVDAKGFAQAIATVPVQVTSVQSITVTLKPAALTETVK